MRYLSFYPAVIRSLICRAVPPTHRIFGWCAKGIVILYFLNGHSVYFYENIFEIIGVFAVFCK